jgi:opacity protein-like surface antigen
MHVISLALALQAVDSGCDWPDHRGMKIHLLSIVLVSCLTQTALAQEAPPADSGGYDVIGGVAGVVGVPVGDFSDNVDTAWGGSGFVLATRHRGVFGLRLQGDVVAYGIDTVHVPRGGNPHPDFTTDVRTTNWIGTLTAGPQLMLRRGPVRPYIHVTAGISYFSTDSEASYTRTTNYQDYTFAYGASAGALVPLNHDLALDFGVRYAGNNDVDYLVEGDVVEGGRRVIGFTPHHGKANMVEFHIGISFGH